MKWFEDVSKAESKAVRRPGTMSESTKSATVEEQKRTMNSSVTNDTIKLKPKGHKMADAHRSEGTTIVEKQEISSRRSKKSKGNKPRLRMLNY